MILPSDSANLTRVAKHLRAGGIAGIPTETVYGLAANALDATACAQIFAAKERPTFDPLIVHLAAARGSTPFAELEQSQLVRFAALSTRALAAVRKLADHFWPGPLTLVLPKTPRVPDLITAGLPSVAIRFPQHPVAQQLLRECACPLAAPSANRFGRISPTQAEHVQEELGDRVPYILDGGACTIGLESTVLRVGTDGGLELLRPGKISAPEIEAATGEKVQAGVATLDQGPQTAPGMLASHYAPSKTLIRLPKAVGELTPREVQDLRAQLNGAERVGLLVLQRDRAHTGQKLERELGALVEVYALSPTGDLAEAAQNLFATLRAMDSDPGLKALFCEPGPEGTGLAHAITDRLNRASRPL